MVWPRLSIDETRSYSYRYGAEAPSLDAGLWPDVRRRRMVAATIRKWVPFGRTGTATEPTRRSLDTEAHHAGTAGSNPGPSIGESCEPDLGSTCNTTS